MVAGLQDANSADGLADNVMRIDEVRAAPGAAPVVEAKPRTDAAAPTGSDTRPKRKTPFWVIGARLLLPLLIIAGGVATFQYFKSTRAVQPPATPSETRFTVDSVTVALADVQPRVQLFGNSVAGREVQMRALVAGRVIDTNPDLQDGAVIRRGDMLLRIDPFDYQSTIAETEAQRAEAVARREELQAALEVERGNLSFARQQLKLAQTDLNRAEQLSRRGNLSERSLDDRRLLVTQRQQTVTQTENNLKVSEARIKQQDATIKRFENSLVRARQRLAETTLSSPFDAYVTDVSAQTGRMLSVNDAVATLIDRKAIDVKFALTDPQYGRLAASSEPLLGRAVQVTWDVGGVPVTYQATIDRVAARVSSEAGGVEVFAKVQNPDGRVPLRPGAFVSVSLNDVLYESVAKIPASAVYDRTTIYVNENGRMQARTVEVLGLDGEDVLVRGDLKSGDKVIVTRLSTPGTGVAVKER